MTTPPPFNPITRLLNIHAETRRRLLALAEPGPDTRTLAAWIEGPANSAHQVLEQHLFPALIESMAGSDAVCLRGMTNGLIQDHADLNRRWQRTIRPLLDTQDPIHAELSTWTRDYLAYLQCADEELLPMADRLLDQAAFNALAAICAQVPIDT